MIDSSTFICGVVGFIVGLIAGKVFTTAICAYKEWRLHRHLLALRRKSFAGVGIISQIKKVRNKI